MRIAALGLAALLVVGCQSIDAKWAQASDLVDAYLRAASGGDEMRGWSFLDSELQAAMFGNDTDAYVTAIQASDWTEFAWEVGGATSEDDFVFVYVRLIAGDYPAVLIEPQGSFTLASGDGARRSFSVQVRPLGAMTLFAAGG